MITPTNSLIVILGASDNPSRYSYRCLQTLQEKGFNNIIGVNPKISNVLNTHIVQKLSDIKEHVHTLTIYLSPENQMPLYSEIISLNPRRIIFNPGAENPELMFLCENKEIEIIEGCSIVMLISEQF